MTSGGRWELPSHLRIPILKQECLEYGPRLRKMQSIRAGITHLPVLKGEQTLCMHSCLCLRVYALAHERFLDDRSPSLHPCSVLWRIFDKDGSIALHACKTKTGCTAGYAKNAMRLPWDRLLLVGEQHSGPNANPWLGRKVAGTPTTSWWWNDFKIQRHDNERVRSSRYKMTDEQFVLIKYFECRNTGGKVMKVCHSCICILVCSQPWHE